MNFVEKYIKDELLTMDNAIKESGIHFNTLTKAINSDWDGLQRKSISKLAKWLGFSFEEIKEKIKVDRRKKNGEEIEEIQKIEPKKEEKEKPKRTFSFNNLGGNNA